MDSDSDIITNLEILTEITCKLEFELNRVKDWIKTQLAGAAELNGYKNNFRTDSNNQNLTSLKNYNENGGQIFLRTQMPNTLLFTRPIVISTTSLNQNQISTNPTNTGQNVETNDTDDDTDTDDEIEIIEDTRDRNVEPDVIIPHSIEIFSNDNSTTTTTTTQNQYFRDSSESVETGEIDPLSAAAVKTYENDKVDTTSSIITVAGLKYKIKMLKKADNLNLNRIKSEQILESAKKRSRSWTQHKNMTKGYICQICTKSFKKYVLFKSHMQTHSTTMNYQCKFCPRKFKTYNSMANHGSRVHRSERNDYEFKCDCGLSFNKEYALENHKNEFHIGLECRYCKAVFYRKRTLYNHIQKTHLICGTSSCAKRFSSLKALKVHRRNDHSSNRNQNVPLT